MLQTVQLAISDSAFSAAVREALSRSCAWHVEAAGRPDLSQHCVLVLDEAQQMVDLRHQVAVAAENFPGIIQSDFGAEYELMGFGQGMNDLGREIVAFQSHGINTARLGWIAFHEHVRGYVVPHRAAAGHEAVAADGGKMMHSHGPGKRSVIVDVNVSRQ